MKKFEIHGMKELNKTLASLPAKIEKKILRSMVRAGAQVVRKAAIENLGGDKKNIIVKPSRSKSRGKIVVQVGPPAEKFYLRFKEFGTKPHLIKTKRSKSLMIGDDFAGREIMHPGQPAQPFLRPAFDENVTRVIEAMRKQGEKRIEKEAAK